MADEVQEYLDLEGLTEYHSKVNALFEDLTIEEVEEAFNELNESDPSYSAFYDIITKAKEASKNAEDNAASAEAATEKANTAATNAEEATTKANEASEKVNELIDSINDDTTGINLLRGTRDWTKGTDLLGTVFYSDGFYGIDLANVFSVEKDTDGFGMLVFNKSSASSSNNYVRSSYISLDSIETLTISGEIKISSINVQPSDNFLRYFGLTSSGEQGELNPVSFEKLGIDITKLNVWQTFKLTMDVSSIAKSNPYFGFHLLFGQNTIGTLFMKKLALNEGSIRNPIWSASPFDIDYINDETTGINLLRGTRDLQTGTAPSGKPNAVYLDGIVYTSSNWEVIKADCPNDFNIVKRTPTGTASHLYFNPVFAAQTNNQPLTFSTEVMFLDRPTENLSLLQIAPYTGSNTASVYKTATIATFGLDYNTVPLNEWIKLIWHVDPMQLEENGWLRVALTGNSNDVSVRYYRKPKLEIGNINNPEWSASPFDVDRINDITTGTNLLGGTRDISQGTELFTNEGAQNRRYKNGFARIIEFSYIEDVDGFTKATLSSTESSPVRYLNSSILAGAFESGEDITFFGKFKIDGRASDIVPNNLFTICKIENNGTMTNLKTVSFVELGFTKNSIRTGVWQDFKYVYKTSEAIDGETVAYFVSYFSQIAANTTTSFSFKQLGAYRGYINNPIWSAGLFDITQNSVNTTTLSSSQFTLGTGVTFVGSTISVSGKTAQLVITAKTTQALASGSSTMVLTLSEELRPVAIGSVVVRKYGCGWINTNGQIEITNFKEIPSGETIYILGTYLLKK